MKWYNKIEIYFFIDDNLTIRHVNHRVLYASFIL